MNPWLGIFAVLAVLSALMGALRLCQGRLPSELSRKAVHVGMSRFRRPGRRAPARRL